MRLGELAKGLDHMSNRLGEAAGNHRRIGHLARITREPEYVKPDPADEFSVDQGHAAEYPGSVR
jgi:hypothetical protein